MGIWETVKSMDPDNVFSYSTLKIVTIRDRRLGILHYLFQLGIFLYIIIYTIVIQQRYLKTETPFGSIRSTLQEPIPWIDAATVPYCTQQQPSYVGRVNYNCTYMQGRDSQYPPASMDSIFVTTRIKDIYYPPPVNCSSGVSDTGVPIDLACAPSSANPETIRYYVGAVEEYTVYIEHAVYGQVTDITTTNEDLKGELIYADGTQVNFEPGNPIRQGTGDVFTVATLLKAAGIDTLDSDSSVNAANTKRYDGVLVIVVIEYSNRNSDSSAFKYKYTLHVLPGVDVIAEEPSTIVNNTVFTRSRYGVRFMFIVAGTIGVFDFPSLLTSIVNGLVLLKVASTIVDLLLLYAMPEKSIYKKAKYELTEDFSDVRDQKRTEKNNAVITD